MYYYNFQLSNGHWQQLFYPYYNVNPYYYIYPYYYINPYYNVNPYYYHDVGFRFWAGPTLGYQQDQ